MVLNGFLEFIHTAEWFNFKLKNEPLALLAINYLFFSVLASKSDFPKLPSFQNKIKFNLRVKGKCVFDKHSSAKALLI